MAFTKTTWVDGSVPAITAEQLNRIEQGIADADALVPLLPQNASTARMYWGHVEADGTSTIKPAGWATSTLATGRRLVTHGIDSVAYLVFVTPSSALGAHDEVVTANVVLYTDAFEVGLRRSSSGDALANYPFSFLVIVP